MHRAGQRNHAGHRMVLWQRRVDDVVPAASDHRVATSRGQDVPEEKNGKPNQNTKSCRRLKARHKTKISRRRQEIVVNPE